jgi:endoglucanase
VHRRIGFQLVAGALILTVAAACGRTPASSAPRTAAPVATVDPVWALQVTWDAYKHDFVQGDGRVIDHQRNQETTSEGQSYAMLRAVWLDDRATFDRVWLWTRNNLQVIGGALFGYLWGPQPDGRYTLLSNHSASDADEDIALALLFATARWHDGTYRRQATSILAHIWTDEVTEVQGVPYLTAGNWAPQQARPGPAFNPSYLAPYAYRVFARADAAHDWTGLVTSSYRLLDACTTSSLGGNASAGLPPNWCSLDRTTGAVVPFSQVQDADSYGFDAFRVMWRVALDVRWNQSAAGRDYLSRNDFLRRQWTAHHSLASVYHHDGTVEDGDENVAAYGGSIGNFVVTDPADAQAMASAKLLGALGQQAADHWWGQRGNYYTQNWAWFGVALTAGQLPQLATG